MEIIIKLLKMWAATDPATMLFKEVRRKHEK